MPHNSTRKLVEQIADRLGPDAVWRELHRYIPSIQERRNGQIEVKALCPDHDDHKPSWHWNLAKGIAVCPVCDKGTSLIRFIAEQTNRPPVAVLDDFCQQLGLTRLRKRILTVADYATAKQLPAEFLGERFALRDSVNGLEIPYIGTDGSIAATRTRKTLGTKPRWSKGVEARRMTYGLHGLSWIGATGYAFVVEGESDLHTAWFHDLPTLATPGATTGIRALANAVQETGVHTTYIIPDADAAGRTMLRKTHKALLGAGWTGTALAVMLPTKDLSELHTDPDVDFDAALNACLLDAVPVADALARFELETKAEDQKMTATIRALLPNRDLSGNDKVIILAVADAVGCDPKRPLPVAKNRLAKLAGVPRRTLYDRLPHIIAAGLLVDDGAGLRLGSGVVR